VAKITTYFKLENIESFLVIAPIQEKLREVDEGKLEPDAREALDAFQEAIEKRDKGITDDW
jgi:hypothetical protein